MPVIATNSAANTALIFLNKNSENQAKSLAKLSSGSRIVRASDDAAGLAVASRLKADVTALQQSARNVIQARAVLQTADGALARVGDILQRMKALAAQSISGSVDNTSRGFIDQEYQQLAAEINSIAVSTTFNGTSLIDGTYSPLVATFMVGTDAVNDVIDASLVNVDAQTNNLGNNGGFTNTLDSTDLLTQVNATGASNSVDVAIEQVSSFRAEVGSLISRFEFRGEYIQTAQENLSAAYSSIMDVDIAAEQAALVSYQVLTEASIAALAQANQMKSSLLQLLR